ncbi:MAG: STAS domain-containing protein [Chloroflexi bacterium]|nr:MAG: STAS domain-containing protein [Chloroflexota bacterium]
MERRRQHVPGAVYQDKQLVIVRVPKPSGLRFVGAIDATNVGPLAEVLAQALDGRSEAGVHLDLSRLDFIDASGIRTLVSAAEKADGTHRLILHGLQPLMRKVMELVGWVDLPTLYFADTGFPDDHDISQLDQSIIDKGGRSHHFSHEASTATSTDGNRTDGPAPADAPLPPPPRQRYVLPLTIHRLHAMRAVVAAEAAKAGLAKERASNLVIAANEVATNSLRQGRDTAVLRIWKEDEALVCEVSDRGQLASPLADRQKPAPDLGAGRGLWLANHLCDLMQLRSEPDGTTVRLRMWLKQPVRN